MSKTILRAVAAMATAAAITCGAATPALAQQAATVEARSAPGGVAVTWRLAEPTTRVAFLTTAVIRDTWTMTTPGLTLADGAVVGEAPFQTFEILISPDKAEVDRIYMSLSKAGEGHVLYGPALTLKDMDAELTAQLATGEVAVPTTDAVKGYLYLGPQEALMRHDGVAVVTSPSAPPALTTLLRDGFFAAQKFYNARLGDALPNEPTLIISTDSPGPTGFRGDVTDTGLISLRFHGDMWASPPPDVAVPLGTFVWHESFHLWNGNGMKMRDSGSAPWLHEGMAEYAALVAAVSSGVVDEGQARIALNTRLRNCRSMLNDDDYDPARLRKGQAIYDCGVLVQWLADLEERQGASGRRDIFDLWKEMLDAGRDGDGYGVADFRARLRPDTAVAVLMDGPGAERWAGIEARLTALGVTLEDRPDAGDYRRTALWHMARQHCTGSLGFFENPDGLQLETGERCGVLSGNPKIAAVEGHDPIAEAEAMFRAVQARCAAAAPVRYRTLEGRLIEAECKAEMVMPKVAAVGDAPPLATRAQ
ncbi:hypothetical protein O3U67_07970 [Brevundimonas diminuta]|uniref:hypothetical protein n=1 Tax=Brevundimonas diminuta TaxID=293 RepID=UPI0022AF2121|nr:hypothetical protein [Brevundimonas diminuta]MCZ4108013.1 hypothetical protein [Brevundimonas diminuta]